LTLASSERLDLDHGRSAVIARLPPADGPAVRIVVTHLHHLVPDAAVRDEQTSTLVEALGIHGAASVPTIVMGDFNADPAEPAYARMREAGFTSAFAAANGSEPAVTWPSGLQ